MMPYRDNAYRRQIKKDLDTPWVKPFPFPTKVMGYVALLAANAGVLAAEGALMGGAPPPVDETPILSLSNAPIVPMPPGEIYYLGPNVTPVYGAPSPAPTGLLLVPQGVPSR
jgi:hypothetical protein